MRILLIALVANCAALAGGVDRHTVPLLFLKNQGQAPAQFGFMAKGVGLTAYFAPDGVAFRLSGSTIRTEFVGAGNSVPEGSGLLPTRANFFTGPREAWQTGVTVYSGVKYREIYPGIDAMYGGDGRQLKSEFVVAPGADPSSIRVRYLSGGELRIAGDGALVIPVDGQELRELAPVAYQEYGNGRVTVACRFVLTGRNTVGFSVDDYDASSALIIDPVLSYSTYLGGSGSDSAAALAVDSAGAAYVAGFTASQNLPIASSEQSSNAGGNDIFVAKLNATGNGLVYCTYIGGSGDDRATGIALGTDGSAYVTGFTQSKNFPVRSPLQSKLAGGQNAFVLKLSPSGNALLFSTYLGGSSSDAAYGIALDGSGNAYVVGDTTSANFPATGFQSTNRGGQDVFIAKLSADGSSLLYSTYLGGYTTDHGAAIAVDTSGNAYVTGYTLSTDFPLANALQPRIAGMQAAFVSKLNASGKALLFSTYLGGTSSPYGYPQTGYGITVDAQGSAYVAGVTSAPDFPLLNPLQSSLRGSTDAFVTKLSASGSLAYSTYVGGASTDAGTSIAVDSGGNAFVAGYTYSSDLPVVGGFQSQSGGNYDAFLVELNAAGSAIVYSTYLGGNGSDAATAVALDPAGNASWPAIRSRPISPC
jgi:hypothetical protein